MRDRETLRMVVFKLQETAGRVTRLAREIKSPRAREQLTAIAAELLEHGARLQALTEEGAPDDSDVKSDEDDSSEEDRARFQGRERLPY